MLKPAAPVEAPDVDKSKFVFILFYALGLLTYVPQNFYITATGYWMYKFRDPNVTFNETDTSEKTPLQTNFASYYSIVGGVSMVTLLVLTLAFLRKIQLHVRTVTCISVQLILFIITIIFVWVDTDTWQNSFFVFTLIIGAFFNGTGATFLVSVFELSAKFSSLYLGAVMAGQAICGVVAALVQIITLAMQTSARVNATLYFIIGAFFVMTVEILYIFTFIVKRKDAQSQPMIDTKKTEPEKKMEFNRQNLSRIAKKVALIPLIMFLVQGSTVMVHPGVTALVESTANAGKWSDVFFVPFTTYFLNNTFDFMGRELALRWRKPDQLYIIVAAGVIRLGFVPLLMFCNIQPRNHLPVAFAADYFYIIFIIIFGFTNGYFMNLSVIKLSSICKPEEMDIAIRVLLLVMIVSLSSCAFLSKLLINSI